MGGAGAKRRNRKSRAIEGMIMRIKKDIMEKRIEMEVRREELMIGRIKRGEEKWKIMEVYVGKGEMKKILKELEEWIENREEGIQTIIGDFNVRIGGERKE